jgi:serine phosphatase RsbU (regulator of sigma subunit)
MATAPPADRHRLRAFEIWGGNTAACESLAVPGFDMQVVCQPYKGKEGGDLRYVSTCAMGNIVRITLADIAGHGTEASQTALRLRDLMRKHINKPNPTKFARALNHEFARLSLEGIFATAVICTYFAPTDHLIVCNAGHPRPLFYSAARKGWTLLDQQAPGNLAQNHAKDAGVGNLPLGIIGETNYPQYAMKLIPGDVVISYTDALIESTNPAGKQLGEQGLLDMAAKLDTSKPDDIASSLVDLVRGYRGGKASDDDVSVIAFSHNASNPPRMALGERLNVLGRMVGFMK